MHRHILTIVIVALMELPAAAAPFYLKHEQTGKLYGPYDFKQGAKVRIGRTDFRLVKAGVSTLTLNQALDATIIPDLNFSRASARDVVEFLRQASIEHSPVEDPGQKGVNIILRLPEGTGTTPAITFRARNLTLRQALRAVTGAANLSYTVESGWILIEPKQR